MQYIIARHTALIILSFCLVLFASSCAHKEAFEKSLVVPSASGRIKVKKDNNNNYSIQVEVKDLTTPENLIPSKKAYLVWNEASNGVFNVGQLITSRSFLQRGFKASLTAISPNKPNRIFITAEDNTNTLSPGPQVVLTTPGF